MSRLTPSLVSSEVVKLSYWVFAAWWLIILGIHIVTGVYTALYAYCYYVLKDTYLNSYLDSYQIGMPQPYHRTISAVHASMSAIHGVCIVLMLGGSIWQRSLAFTPWSSCNAGAKTEVEQTSRTRSLLVESFSKAYVKVTDRHGLFGVNGNHFHVLLVFREVIETVLQTVQAYRMSMLLPRTSLNRFYVVLLAVNCWSSVIVYSVLFKGDEARKRFMCIVLDCTLDLMTCMGVELMILLSYASDYVVEIRGFWGFLWQYDKWAARALNEFRMVVVVSWSDLISRAFFSFGLFLTTTNMKELLEYSPRRSNRVAKCTDELAKVHETDLPGANSSLNTDKVVSVMPKSRLVLSRNNTSLRSHIRRHMLRTVHLLFAAWGLAVLGLHIQASVQPSLPQCLMQVRPWAASRPSCYLVGIDCHTLAISGTMNEVEGKFSEFDGTTVVQLRISHCPDLEMPDSISEFHGLHGIKVYNSTILDWGESAAITGANHPELTSLYIVRTNMTDGMLPAGFQSVDFPQNLYDIEFCVTNLNALPDDIDTKWHTSSILIMEYSQLLTVPSVVLRLEPIHLSVTGNPITEIPPEVFELPGLVDLGIGGMNLDELPRDVTAVSPTLLWIRLGYTNISFFWSWTDQVVAMGSLIMATNTPYCQDFERIQSGAADTFSVSPSPEYSSVLMDPSEVNLEVILTAVYCGEMDLSMYFLLVDDYYLAISTPPT
ncbi:hypothetical protein AM587_10011240 [Phytophthora nicotianae]|uniref:Uncharacterized protein n=1 Tax=Phytophthora nicotianae TaxID=4792 RepID=A0A0W8CT25_PHYNI|nr:hypothetical protein AM587_10011240 [Phytophthora nicotianae]